MTKREMIDSYIRGELDRRGFIRGLTALGVSAGAAATYAVSFSPSAAASGGFVVRPGQQYQDQNYPPPPISLEEAIARLLEAITRLLNLLIAALERFLQADFTAAGLPSNTFELLSTIQSQLNDQTDALNALGGGADTGSTSASLAATSTALARRRILSKGSSASSRTVSMPSFPRWPELSRVSSGARRSRR